MVELHRTSSTHLAEISRRYSPQVKEHFHHHGVDKDRELLRNEVTKIKKQIVSGEHIALNQRTELEKLNLIIQEAEEERQRQVRHDRCLETSRPSGYQGLCWRDCPSGLANFNARLFVIDR